MIDIKNLTKKYRRKVALYNISWNFTQGEIHGLIGENGAGKSSLIRCILGLEDYEGIIDMPTNVSCGYLPDVQYYYPFMTGKEYIYFCLKARNRKIDETEIANQNKYFNLPLDDYCSSYSLGMKKRLALLSLMLQKCSVYILDEPCNGLDLKGVIYFKRWCIKQKERGATIIITSHLISSLSEICDDILYIHEGRIVRDYTPHEYDRIEDDIMC